MNDAKCLAMQWIAAKKSREEINRHIKKVEQQLLEIKRDHVWDQERLTHILSELPEDNRPGFITETTTYKVDYRAFQSYAMGNPSDALVQALHGAHSIKLGDSKIKSINQNTIKEAE